MRGRNKKRISVLGILIGIMWAASFILIIAGYYERNKETESYAPSADNLLYYVDNQDYSGLRSSVSSARYAGVTEDTHEVYREIFAVSDYVDATAFAYVYEMNNDVEMTQYYYDKCNEAFMNMGDLEFTATEVERAFNRY